MDHKFEFSDVLNNKFSFDDLVELKAFLEAEKTTWEENLTTIKKGSDLHNIPQRFTGCIDAIKHFHKYSVADETATQALDQAFTHFRNWVAGHWISSDSPACKAIVAANTYSKVSGDNCWQMLVAKKRNMRDDSAEAFIGQMIAYEFLAPEAGQDPRLKAEVGAFAEARKQIEAQLDALSQQKKKLRYRIEEIVSDWKSTHGQIQSDTQTMLDAAESRHQELEDLYQEKLRLKAPAQYWQQRAKSLGFHGGLWVVLLILSTVALAIVSGLFFWSWLHKPPIEFGLASLQGVALFGTTVAAGAYLLRTLSRLTFSAFHLKRDAEEREQLAHLYLALINEGAIDSNSRDIVLQALFSRADSGLLLGDSAPTMPSAADVIAGMSRIKPQG